MKIANLVIVLILFMLSISCNDFKKNRDSKDTKPPKDSCPKGEALNKNGRCIKNSNPKITEKNQRDKSTENEKNVEPDSFCSYDKLQFTISDEHSFYPENGATNLKGIMPEVEAIYLADTEITDIRELKKYPTLKLLSVSFSQFDDWSQLRELESVKSLEVGGFHKSLEDLFSSKENFPKIEDLFIRNTNLTDVQFRLGQFPNLKSIEFQMTKIGTDITSLVDWLSSMPKLEQLVVHFNGFIGAPEVDLRTLERLSSKTKNLKILSIKFIPWR